MGWLFLDRLLRMGVGLIVGVWVARYLGPEQFGLLSFAIAFAGLFGAMATMGLHEVVVRDLIRDSATQDQTLGAAAILQAAGGLLAYGLMLAVIFWMRPEDSLAKLLVAIIGAATLFKISDVAVYWFEAHVQSKYAVWTQNGAFLAFAAVKMALILSNASLPAFALATTAEALVAALGLVLVLRLRGVDVHLLRARFERIPRLLADSWPLLLSAVMVTIYMRIDQIMLGQMVDDKAVGIYSAAVRISEIWYFVPLAIVASVFPAILEAKKHGESLYRDRLQRLYCIMVWLSIVVAVSMTFLSKFIVTLLFGAPYADAASILAIHLWAAPFVFLGVASGKWFVIENRQLLSLQRTALGVASNIALNSIFIPKWGGVGAAWATVISYGIAAMFADLLQRETRGMFWMKVRSFDPRGMSIK